MAKLSDFKIYVSVVLVSLLCACANQAGKASPGTPGHSRAQALSQAEKYQKLAGKDATDMAANYRLRAAEQLVIAGQYEKAIEVMEANKKRRLNAENTAYKHLILAQMALAHRDIGAAHTQLSNLWTPLQLPEYLRIRFYTARSNAFLLSGNDAEAIQERVFLAKHIKNPTERKTNYIAIWDILDQTSPNTLKRLQQTNNKETNGWVALALINKEIDADPAAKMQALATWKEQNPSHPAIAFMQMPDAMPVQVAEKQNFINKINPYNGRSVSAPRKIALLLPLQGEHAKSAQAVRDGFLSAYYAHGDGPKKPTIQVYDTTRVDNIAQAYHAAVNEGAEFIVGPLIKEEVEALNSGVRPSIPVLALNVTQDNNQENVFQFGLSPEMEARTVADRAWRDGHRKALIVAPKSAWGQRMENAFTARWHELGGMVLASQQVASQSNINKEMQALLAIDASEARAKELKSLGLRFNSNARRRQDPDMIFIATNAALARQVKPLLNFYYAGKLPAYASSSIFSGRIQPGVDQDLNGIKFCDMPWILDPSVRAGAHRATAGNYSLSSEQTARLYALGLDAYKVAVQIDQLTTSPELGVSGMTGVLTLDQQQNVQRKLMWASFRKGTPYVEGEQL
jgi:outer membrane PBP1 activator LpoA protein